MNQTVSHTYWKSLSRRKVTFSSPKSDVEITVSKWNFWETKNPSSVSFDSRKWKFREIRSSRDIFPVIGCVKSDRELSGGLGTRTRLYHIHIGSLWVEEKVIFSNEKLDVEITVSKWNLCETKNPSCVTFDSRKWKFREIRSSRTIFH